MGLESVTYISDLVVTNPVGGSDSIGQGDDHIRNIKIGLKNSFPNITGAMNATQTELNALVGVAAALVEITGNTTLLNTDFAYVPQISFVSATAIVTLPAASTVASGKRRKFYSTTTASVTFAPNGTDTIGGANAAFRLAAGEDLELTSNGTGAWILTIRPAYFVGQLIEAGGSAAPSGTYIQALDGSAISRTTYAGLFAVIGTTFGTGDGSTTFNVPDTRGRSKLGSGTGTLVASGTDSGVDISTDAFTVTSNNATWITGMPVTLGISSGTITGVIDTGSYFIIRASSTTVKLASTLANAVAGTAIDLTAKSNPTWSLTHTLTARTLGEKLGEESHGLTKAETPVHNHTITDPGHAHTYTAGGGGNSGDPGEAGSGNGYHSDNTGGANTGISLADSGSSNAHNIMQPSLVITQFIKT